MEEWWKSQRTMNIIKMRYNIFIPLFTLVHHSTRLTYARIIVSFVFSIWTDKKFGWVLGFIRYFAWTYIRLVEWVVVRYQILCYSTPLLQALIENRNEAKSIILNGSFFHLSTISLTYLVRIRIARWLHLREVPSFSLLACQFCRR